MGAKCHCCACQSILGVWSLFCVWCAMGWTKLINGDGLILRREAVGTPEVFAVVIRLVELKGKWDRAEFPLLMNCRTCAGQLNVCCHFQKKDIYTWRCLPMSIYFQFSTCVSTATATIPKTQPWARSCFFLAYLSLTTAESSSNNLDWWS